MMFVYESLGSAQPCPGSAILPPDYMQTTGAAPLESTAKTEKPFPTAALVVGSLLVGGGILWLMSGGAIVLDNPGLAAKRGVTRSDVDPSELRRGIKHEMEHTDSPKVAERIALDHLAEHSEYYSKLEAVMKDNPIDNSTLAIGAAIGAAVAGIAWLLTRKSSTSSATATGPLPAPPAPLTTPQSTTTPLTSSAAVPFTPAAPQSGPTSSAAPSGGSSAPGDTASFGDVYAPLMPSKPQTCWTNAHCPPGQICQGNVCVPGG